MNEPTPDVNIRVLGQPPAAAPEPAADPTPDKRGSAADSAARAFPLRSKLRLATRIAWPASGAARRDALRIFWSTAVAALPCALWLAAPDKSVGGGAFFALACAAAPGTVATVLAASRAREQRTTTSKALWQAGAEQKAARRVAAVRTAVCASLGALLGAVAIPLATPLLKGVLPQQSPLRAMLAASQADWLGAIIATVVLATAGALVIGAPFWSRIDRSALDWRRPATVLTALKARSPLR
jgi:cation transport ATPase